MNIYMALLLFDTLAILFLTYAMARLDKKCWDLLGVIKGMHEKIKELEKKVGLVHSDI